MNTDITMTDAITALVAEKRAVGYKYAAEARVLARFAAFSRDQFPGLAAPSRASVDVNAHVIPRACAQVIPQVVGPGDVLLGGLLRVVGDTPGAFVWSVAGAVHEDLVAGVDQSVE